MKSLIVAGLVAVASAADSHPLVLRSTSPGLGKRASAAAQLESANSYLTAQLQISVGTPPQPMAADLNVDSGDTLVGGSPYDGGSFYAPTSSTLKKGAKITHPLSFAGNETTQGVVATDILRIGQWSQETAFVLSDPSGENGLSEPPGINNAVLGLGYNHALAGPLSDAWDEKVWGLYLAPRTVRGSGISATDRVLNTGALSLGKTDPVYMAGDAHWLNITDTSAGRWAVPLTGVSLNGKAADMGLVRPVGGVQSIAVGLYYSIGLPGAVVDGLLSSVSGAKKWAQPGAVGPQSVWTLPCGADAALTISLGGRDFPLQLADWVAQGAGGADCEALLYASDATGEMPWLGVPLLQTVYSVWDVQAPRLGLAPAKASGARIANKHEALDGTPAAPARESAPLTTTGQSYPTAGSQGQSASSAGAARPALLAGALAAVAGYLFL